MSLDNENQDQDLSNDATLQLLLLIQKFLQLLCENHNVHLQNHLRKQLNEFDQPMGKSFNFINQAAVMLGQFIKIFNTDNSEVGVLAIECLTEFVQGPCRENQRSLISAKVIDHTRDFIQVYIEEIEDLLGQ